MEERKSVLETVRPADAVGRYESRSKTTRPWLIAGLVVVLIFVVYIVGTIIHRTVSGTDNLSVPRVLEP